MNPPFRCGWLWPRTAIWLGGSGATGSTTVTAGYRVMFYRDVTGCAYITTIGTLSTGITNPGTITLASAINEPNGVFVRTQDTSGNDISSSFHLAVYC